MGTALIMIMPHSSEPQHGLAHRIASPMAEQIPDAHSASAMQGSRNGLSCVIGGRHSHSTCIVEALGEASSHAELLPPAVQFASVQHTSTQWPARQAPERQKLPSTHASPTSAS